MSDNSDELSDLVVSESRGKISDFFCPPPSVKISSDIEREIICAKQGRTAGSFFDSKKTDERPMKHKLATTVSIIIYLLKCLFLISNHAKSH